MVDGCRGCGGEGGDLLRPWPDEIPSGVDARAIRLKLEGCQHVGDQRIPLGQLGTQGADSRRHVHIAKASNQRPHFVVQLGLVAQPLNLARIGVGVAGLNSSNDAR
ncbi:hypothetical protein D3C80_1100190 [compost metagenome]